MGDQVLPAGQVAGDGVGQGDLLEWSVAAGDAQIEAAAQGEHVLPGGQLGGGGDVQVEPPGYPEGAVYAEVEDSAV